MSYNTLDTLSLTLLMHHKMVLRVTHKHVKNINFRVKVGQLSVSAPFYASDSDIATAVSKRLNWIVDAHAKIIARQEYRLLNNQPADAALPLILWGETHAFTLNETQRLKKYRAELHAVMPSLFAKWQPIVGKTATEHRIKKMKTRWGSCNTTAKRIWLSVHLAEYPIECTEYVIVHELCHLHHADHSANFWAEVRRAMPDYQHWHDMLAGKHRHM